MYNLQNIKKIAEEKRISIRELAEFCGKTTESLHGSIKIISSIHTAIQVLTDLKTGAFSEK